MEESGIETKGAKGVNSMNIHHIGMYLILSFSWEGAKQCPSSRIGILDLAEAKLHFEYWDH